MAMAATKPKGLPVAKTPSTIMTVPVPTPDPNPDSPDPNKSVSVPLILNAEGAGDGTNVGVTVEGMVVGSSVGKYEGLLVLLSHGQIRKKPTELASQLLVVPLPT